MFLYCSIRIYSQKRLSDFVWQNPSCQQCSSTLLIYPSIGAHSCETWPVMRLWATVSWRVPNCKPDAWEWQWAAARYRVTGFWITEPYRIRACVCVRFVSVLYLRLETLSGTDGGWSLLRYDAVYVVIVTDVSEELAFLIPRLQTLTYWRRRQRASPKWRHIFTSLHGWRPICWYLDREKGEMKRFWNFGNFMPICVSLSRFCVHYFLMWHSHHIMCLYIDPLRHFIIIY
jgi:hypothetical protein